MNFEFVNTIFLLNYFYLLFYLVTNIKSYRTYLLLVVAATISSLVPLVYQYKYNFYLTIANGVIFIVLAVVPGMLTKMIYHSTNKKFSNKIYFYSLLRYFITFAPIHKHERDVFKTLHLLHKGKLNESMTFARKLFGVIPQQFHSVLHTCIFLALSYKGDFKEAIATFEENLANSHVSLRHIIEVYAEEDQLEKAAEFLAELEREVEINREDLHEARCIFYAYLGNFEQINRWENALCEWRSLYVKGVFHRIKGNSDKAREYLYAALEKCDKRATAKIKLHIERLNVTRNLTPPSHEVMLQLESNMERPKVYVEKRIEEPFEVVNITPIFTWGIIIANAVMFVLSEFLGGSTDILVLTNLGSNDFLFVEHQGEYWRFVSSLFLHFGYLHIILNMFGLYLFGKLVEGLYGWKNLLIIYFATGIFASIVSFFTHSTVSISVGASGAVCGLLGLNTYYFLFCGEMNSAVRNHYIFSFLFMIFAMIGMSFFFDFIDNAAHFAGIGAGFAIGFVMDRIWRIGEALQKICVAFITLILLLTYLSVMQNFATYPYNVQLVTTKVENLQLDIPFSWKSYIEQKKGAVHEYKYFDRYSVSNRLKYPQAFLHLTVCPDKQLSVVLTTKMLQTQRLKNVKIKNVGALNITQQKSWRVYRLSYDERIKRSTVRLQEDWYFCIHGDKGYFFSFIFVADAYEKYQPMVLKILESIKF
ncbi:rhomboid family protein [Candidatus Uabimicrobium amorphum]|uniref:Rhomboid family intramembrane serine protease n=1 Tax=Uabimicrobium amorphum TaxID=2596890 RepID=A0A5S9IPT0_UABAM|nr:rhomboid family intramembrane serine protease [Candidatus Uabimicrobium amorphum]BBM85664.1 rhomboid family intramembrane serine protease [Candidatus Uabimicrobium amorphum]